jgi:hypothetical protein
MNRSTNPFANLADKAARGDLAARNLLQRQLGPQMVHLVRCVVQEGRDRSALDRRILAEATRVGLHAGLASSDERERLIVAVAQRLCTSVISRLGAEGDHRADDTVRASHSTASRTIN